MPENVAVGPRPAHMRSGPDADFEAAPQIAGIWLSDLTLRRGSVWEGAVTTSSNTASVEVRTESFSFSVPKGRSGDFEFHYDIPDLPPYLRRSFMLHVVARNASGASIEEELPIDIQ